jgi:hypothetical protein
MAKTVLIPKSNCTLKMNKNKTIRRDINQDRTFSVWRINGRTVPLKEVCYVIYTNNNQ